MKIVYLISLMIFFLASCGDSPFLEDEEGQEVQGTNLLSQQLSLNSGIQISPYWASGPTIASESKISFLILDKDSRPINEQLDIRVKLWMPTMGHGSFPVTIKYHGLGLYQATDVFFTMPGYWDIHFQLFENGVFVEELKWPLEL